MVDERLDRLDPMEKLLRRILVLQPDNAQALNALGYSLADRDVRLDEAAEVMLRQAHALSPTDPFIVDSLGWAEYRLGHYDTAATLLAQAYSSRQATPRSPPTWARRCGPAASATTPPACCAKRTSSMPATPSCKQTMARLKVEP